MSRTKGRELKTDAEIELDVKNKDHSRKQKLLDVRNLMQYWAMIFIPILLLLWVVVLGVHYIFINDWNSFSALGKNAALVVGGYFGKALFDRKAE